MLASDFGDAPDSSMGTGPGDYESTLANGGPGHTIVLTQTSLFLGAHVDGDTGTLQNAEANADDVNGALPDDEDGVLNPLDLRGTLGAAPTVTLLVTNTTGSSATLAGWIDYNNNGVFETSERATATIVDGTTDARFTLTFPSIPIGFTGTTYARFRLSTDSLFVAAPAATGLVSDGEVEDYTFAMALPSDGTVAAQQRIGNGVGGLPSGTINVYGRFGSAVTGIGDLDGDGIGDIAVGAPLDSNDSSNKGVVYVLLLNSNGTVKSQVEITDGVGGLASGTLDSFDQFGTAVAAIGDLDGDGIDDLAVGAFADRGVGGSEGAVYVLLLNSNGTVKGQVKIRDGMGGLATGTLDSGDQFGSAVTGIGDLDGDGVRDIAVGAIRDDNTATDEGAVYVLLLNSNGTVKSQVKIRDGLNGLANRTLEAGDLFGSAVASVGDLDGDGVGDIAVGAVLDENGDTTEGAVYVLLLNSDGTVKGQVKISDGLGGLASGTLQVGDRFGKAVSSVGDLNGDGVGDIAVGAYFDENTDMAEGAVYVLLMSRDGMVKEQLKISDGLNGLVNGTLGPSNRFGSAVASIGDLNGDGTSDLAVGAWGNPQGGAVYILFLNAALPPETLVSLDANGNLTVTDIADGNSNDELSVTFDAAMSEFVITDANLGVITDIAGASRSFEGRTVRVPQSLVAGDRVVAELLAGNDSLSAGSIPLPLQVDGGEGNDVVSGSPHDDTLQGSAGVDLIVAAADSDITLTNSSLVLSSGGVRLSTDSLVDFELATMTGGTSDNRIDLSGFVTTASFVNTVVGGGGRDTIIATNARDKITTFGSGGDSVDGRDGEDTIFTGNGNDTVNGGWGNDCILGQNGNDSILGGSGDDFLFGNTENDVLNGEAGQDRLFGSAGDDLINGGTENDSLFGDAGNDTLRGDAGNDLLRGSIGTDVFDGGSGGADRVDEAGDTSFTLIGRQLSSPLFGTETGLYIERFDLAGSDSANIIDASQSSVAVILNGFGGNDILIGGAENDRIFGGDDADSLTGNAGSDILNGGNGNDVLSETADADLTLTNSTLVTSTGGVTHSMDLLTSVEAVNVRGGVSANQIDASGFAAGTGLVTTIVGGGGADTIIATEGPDRVITFNMGADSINALSGNDTVVSGGGNDTINGGEGDDVLIGQNGDDSLLGGTGADSVFGNFGNDTLAGGAGNDHLTGLQDDDSLLGGTEADSLSGESGNDTLQGESGDDVLRGSIGQDSLDGGTGLVDRLDEMGDTDVVVTGMQFSSPLFGMESPVNVERFDFTGGPGNNRFDASDASVMVVLNGAAGNDTLGGGSQNDSLFGGSGNDTLNGGRGDDVLEGDEGNDGLSGYLGDDSLFGDVGSDSLFGHDGADLVAGGDDDDTVVGGGGTSVEGDVPDTIDGGTGTDTSDDATGDSVTNVEMQMAFTSFPDWVDAI